MIRRAIPVLHVTNAAKALNFYHELGFQLEFEHHPQDASGDPCYMGISRDGVWLHLSSFAGDGAAGAVANLMVDDVDSLYSEFTAKHVHIDVPPVDQSWGSREMYVKDADGNCLRFIA
jgi:uncharacterized glyoxalase superfamily protein PhnB